MASRSRKYTPQSTESTPHMHTFLYGVQPNFQFEHVAPYIQTAKFNLKLKYEAAM